MLHGRIHDLQPRLRMIYSFVYMLVCAAVFCVPLRSAMAGNDGQLFTVLGVLGLGLMAWDFFTKRTMFRLFRSEVPVLFFVVCLVSLVLNRQYGLFSNLKGVMWVAIQIFLLGAMDADLPGEKLLRWFYRLADLFVAVWLVQVLWSLGQYAVQYAGTGEIIVDGVAQSQRLGFVDSRLFGVFMDPNYASVCSLIAVALAAVNLKCAGHPKAMGGYYIGSMAANLCYVILSGSRTGMIAGIAVGAFCAAFLAAAHWNGGKWIRGALAFLLAGAVSAALLLGAVPVTQKALSYVPGLLKSTMAQQPEEPGETETPGDTGTSKPSQSGPVDFSREDVEDSGDLSNNRFTIWKDCLELVKLKPLFGATARGYMDLAKEAIPDSFLVSQGYSVHNGYLMLLVSTGILGFGVMMIWCVMTVVKILGYLIRRWDSRDGYYWPVFISAMALAVIAISAFPLQSIFFSNQLPDTMFWLLLGFTLAFIRRSEPERHARETVFFRLFNRIHQK